MKRIALIGTLLFCATAVFSQTNTLTLDRIISDFRGYIVGRLPRNSATAVMQIDAPIEALGNYITDELMAGLVNDVRLVSRQDIDRLMRQQDIQTDSGFDDDSTAKIGHLFGWKAVILGTVSPLEKSYHLSLRAVDADSGELLGTKSYVIQPDARLSSLVNPNVTVSQITEREAILQPFTGQNNKFELRIWPSSEKSVYYDNEELFINLQASVDCYFVIYQVDVDNKMQVIYPNFYEMGKNTLKAGVTRTIPEDTSFMLHGPYGEERIMVYASQRPITIPDDQYSPRPITREYLSSPQALWRIDSVPDAGSKAVTITPRGATGQFRYSILPKK
jgi:hypothetical protein